MSLAVSVARGAIAPLQLAVAIILEELEDEIQCIQIVKKCQRI
jgi:hypothetical protein